MESTDFSGILNVLKPPGMTSFDVVGFLRGLLKIRKIGHTGTLDPGAVGVLPICIGKATKAIEYMIDKDKLYRAELTLGISTDSQDSTGKVLETHEVDVTPEEIKKAVKEFTGKILQVPPMYSAVKVEGRKLYELAREGITIEREPRDVEIYSIDIIDINDKCDKVIFDVECSKGTYIRTLCADIGERLGCGGHMSFLIRLKAGSFDISSSATLEELAELAKVGRLREKLISIDEVFAIFKAVVLNEYDETKFLNGTLLESHSEKNNTGEILRIYNKSGCFLALGEMVWKQGKLVLKPKKIF